MRSNRRSTSLVAAVVGAFLLAPIQPPVANGAPTARTLNTLNVSSGSLRIFATTTQSYISTGVALSTSVTNGAANRFFVNNGGSLTVSRFVMTINLPAASNVATFKRCPLGASFTGISSCSSGSPTTLTKPVSGSATNYLISLPGPGFYAFQIVQNKNGTMTVNTSGSLQYVTGSIRNS